MRLNLNVPLREGRESSGRQGGGGSSLTNESEADLACTLLSGLLSKFADEVGFRLWIM